MAGMLPGVESARRRRFHQSSNNGPFDSSSSSLSQHRRSSFCLYSTNHDSHHFSTLQRNAIRQAGFEDVKLDEAAREAKERLDEKLNSQNKKISKQCQERRHANDLKLKKSGSSKRLSWMSKLKLKTSQREECVVCLEEFNGSQTLMELPCTHRFHSRCLVPWLATNAHCPCCRLQISLQ